MKKIMVSLLCVFGNIDAWHYISFDEAMKKNQFLKPFEITERIFGINGHVLYEFCKELYDHNNLSVLKTQKPQTPKIIHQIWLGSPVPDCFVALQESWVEHHLGRDWCYKLWTDEDVAQLHLYNQQFYDETKNYGVKSDIARLEIIYRFGGIYADMDVECLRSFDELLVYDFFIALQPLDSFFVQLNTALFGAAPGHPILKHAIETVKDDWHLQGAPKKTGPVHFTRSFYATAGKNGLRDIALPAYYFCPLGSQEIRIKKSEWIDNGAYAVHWWAKSWMPKEYRSTRFKNIDNDASSECWND